MEKEFLGNFKIIRKVGEGGMAVAYLAHHKEIPDHRVILKQLKDPRHGEKFKKEANNLAKLNDHHNICRIYDYFNDGDRTIIVMEYIEGATLKDVIESEKRLPMNLFLKLGIDLIRIMKYAHDRKMYHRDLKPGNIMVDKQGEIKVIDFGIAKDATDPNETAAGIFSGTPLFAPLEQFNPMGHIDWAKTDIYALGTTLYLMITGRMPFDGDSWDEYAENKRLAEPHPPSAFNPEVSKKLDSIILKSIARLPQDRFASLGEMLEEIEQLRTEKVLEPSFSDKTVDVAHYPGTTQAPSAEKARWGTAQSEESKKPKKGMIIGVSSAVAIAAIGLYLYFGTSFFAGKTDGSDTSQVPNSAENSGNNNTVIPIVAKKGQLEISATPNADFYVDDSMIGKGISTKTIELDSGIYDIRLENSSARTGKQFQQKASVLPGQVAQVSHTFDMGAPSVSTAPAMGTLDIKISPSSDVYIDDKKEASGKSNVSIKAAPGKHTLKVVNDSEDYDSTIIRSVDVIKGKSSEYSFVFEKRTVLGELRVGSIPNQAAVFINGKKQERLTPCILNLPAGTYNVRVWLQSQDISRESTLVVIPGEIVKFQPEFE
ncbi:MAG TPA: serine/threonine-protein kinase [candidate division Zixibacteria bacterium]|nr:serine/threonine-protein kinase [candidate division Zixibacteria bacterium]